MTMRIGISVVLRRAAPRIAGCSPTSNALRKLISKVNIDFDAMLRRRGAPHPSTGPSEEHSAFAAGRRSAGTEHAARQWLEPLPRREVEQVVGACCVPHRPAELPALQAFPNGADVRRPRLRVGTPGVTPLP